MDVRGNGGERRVSMNVLSDSGAVTVSGNDGTERVMIGVDQYGGRVDIANDQGTILPARGVDEYGHCAVSKWDKEGYRTRP